MADSYLQVAFPSEFCLVTHAHGTEACCSACAGPLDKETARKAVQQARMYAVAAVQRAARYAAEGGIPYQPPPGFEMQAGYQTVTPVARCKSSFSTSLCGSWEPLWMQACMLGGRPWRMRRPVS